MEAKHTPNVTRRILTDPAELRKTLAATAKELQEVRVQREDLLAACREAKSLLLNAGDAAKSDAIADCFVAVVRASTNAIDTLRAAIRQAEGGGE